MFCLFTTLQVCGGWVGGFLKKLPILFGFYYLNVPSSCESYFFRSFMFTCCVSLFLSKPLVPTDLLPPAALTGSYKKPFCVEA